MKFAADGDALERAPHGRILVEAVAGWRRRVLRQARIEKEALEVVLGLVGLQLEATGVRFAEDNKIGPDQRPVAAIGVGRRVAVQLQARLGADYRKLLAPVIVAGGRG